MEPRTPGAEHRYGKTLVAHITQHNIQRESKETDILCSARMMPQLFILMKLFREHHPIHHAARAGPNAFCSLMLLIFSPIAMFLCEIIPPDKFVSGARAQRVEQPRVIINVVCSKLCGKFVCISIRDLFEVLILAWEIVHLERS